MPTSRRRQSSPLILEPLEARDVPSVGPLIQVTDVTPFTNTGDITGQSGTVYLNTEVEPRVAVDPSNPFHLVGAWQQDRWSDGGARGLVAGVSTDGGNTWTKVPLPGLTVNAGGGTALRASDPWVTFAPNGDVYAISLPFNASNYVDAIMVNKSTDGGFTWGPPVALTTNTSVALVNDKESITADPTNSNFVYAVWDRLDQNTNRGPALFSRTTNGGQSWSLPSPILDIPNGQTIGNQIVVLPNGTLVDVTVRINYVSSAYDIVALRSTDHGATWSAPVVVATMRVDSVTDPDNGRAVRTGDIIPDVTVDRRTGSLFVVWQDGRFSNGAHADIALSMSLNGGVTRSAPAKVNATPTGLPNGSQQAFTPSVAVLDAGVTNGSTFAVSYYDFRNNTAASGLPTDYWVRFATLSTKGTLALGVEQRLTSTSFEMELAPNAGGYFVGDYQGLTPVRQGKVGAFFSQTVSTSDRASIFFRTADLNKSPSPPAAPGRTPGRDAAIDLARLTTPPFAAAPIHSPVENRESRTVERSIAGTEPLAQPPVARRRTATGHGSSSAPVLSLNGAADPWQEWLLERW